MTTNDPDRDLDDLLRDDAGRIGALYKKLPHYEPPRRLDRAILGEAARAVHSGKPPRRQRWIIGVGSAAGLVLAAGMAWRIGHDAMNEGAVPPAAAPVVVPVQPIDGAARAKREQPSVERTTTTELAPAQPAEKRAVDAAGRADVTREERKVRAAARVAAPPPKPAPTPPPAAEPFPAQTAAPADAMKKDLEHSAEADRAGAQDENSAAKSGPATSGGFAPSSATGIERHQSTKSMPSTPPSGSIELQRDMQLAPVAWLAHIRELEREGRHQQASESLRLFVRSHPTHRIPADLQPLLD